MQINSENLFIHLDLDNNIHDIPLKQSLDIDRAILDLLDGIKSDFFQNGIQFEVYVSVPEDGSHIKNFIIKATALVIAVDVLFSNSDGANALLKTFTGKEYGEIVEIGAQEIKDVAIGFLKSDSKDIIDSGLSIQKNTKIFEAKNHFYQAIQSSDNIPQIGFDTSPTFPIQKTDFPRKFIETKKDTSIPSVDKHHIIKVVSQINSEENKNLSWRVKDTDGDIVYSIYMKDDDFYKLFFLNHIHVSSMLVRVRYKFFNKEGIIYCKREIHRVYNYNDTAIFTLPNDTQIEPFPLKVIDIDNKTIYLNDIPENSSQLNLPV